jgi:hypothetical protein
MSYWRTAAQKGEKPRLLRRRLILAIAASAAPFPAVQTAANAKQRVFEIALFAGCGTKKVNPP